jgi:hypothetical protein
VGVCPGLYDDPNRRSLTGGAHSSSRLASMTPYPVAPVTNLHDGRLRATRSVRPPAATVPRPIVLGLPHVTRPYRRVALTLDPERGA